MARKSDFDADDVSALCEAIKSARMQLKYPRECRREMIRNAAGAYYMEETSNCFNPMNMIALYRQIIGRNLISHNPRVMARTFRRDAKPAAEAMQNWMNKQIEKTGIKKTFARIVDDALFLVGIAKVSIATPSDSEKKSYAVNAGTPFIERVDFEDFVYDVHARDWSDVTYIGHRYRVPIDTVRDDAKLYSKDRKDLLPSDDGWYNPEGDEMVSALSRSPYVGRQEFEEMVDLWEIYIPRKKLFVVLPASSDNAGNPIPPMSGKPLRVFPWVGPACGPYHILGMVNVPGNCLPVGPIHYIYDLHKSINAMSRKLIDQSNRQKTVGVVAGQNTTDADTVTKLSDGQVGAVGVTNPIQLLPFPGPDPALYQAMLQFWDQASKQAGNLELAGGLSPQSKTLGQDKMLNENSTRQIADMQEQTIGFVAECLNSLGELWWNHPEKVMETFYQIDGLPEFTEPNDPVSPLDRTRTKYEDLELQIDPYSLSHKTPSQMVAELDDVVRNIIMPSMGLLAQSGTMFDIKAYLQKRARYMNNPDVTELVNAQEPPMQEGSIGGEEPGMPDNTSREYIRRSVGQNTQANRAGEMMNELSKGAAQPQQA